MWRQHTVYREHGGAVIRGEHVGKWISLTARGTRHVQIRAGRLLEGGTTAPARAETTAPFDGNMTELAAHCRALLVRTVDTTTDTTTDTATENPAAPAQGQRPRRSGNRGAITLAPACSAVALGLLLAAMGGALG
ncbi:hypothetical protein OG204_28880 [Streptomyces sp. NBC_01387]|uniref:hypothetical protein n=1 Tax=unclassified Streptomyces TaxID=2593676 RepID=UPI00225B1D5F|nr:MULTISPECIES: hypothetical protein [unclassified Streptomyces]MCX4547641.1 hypothetical protein [Streptomyces sp. NBC_01500]WSC19330.1 hypothetical protein OIE60_06355 [Streptomyces sp. NBC_01766]WSV53352.1 hypothetical protein OG282_06325 [Streptomyces sp. NBC_01014]